MGRDSSPQNVWLRYRVEFRIPGTNAATAVNDLLVGDLWVLAGQSNMEGVGDLVDTEMPNELVHNFDMADNWMVAEDPLHSLPGAADRVHWRRNANREPERLEGQALRDFIRARKKGAGLGLPFAVGMIRRTSVPSDCFPARTAAPPWTSGTRPSRTRKAIHSTAPWSAASAPPNCEFLHGLRPDFLRTRGLQNLTATLVQEAQRLYGTSAFQIG
jgi:Carbohydrate esterase, sialic acid-specific acetylesterase